MRGARSRLGRRLSHQGGYSLIEVMVAMALMSLIATTFLTVLNSQQSIIAKEDLRSRTLDQARAAMDELDREFRSGNLIYNPYNDAGINCGGYTCTQYYSLRIYTQTNGNTRTPSNQCVQWLLTTNDQLLRRAWVVGASQSLQGWQVVATGIVNRDASVNGGSTYPAFMANSQAPTRTIDIQLTVNATKADPRSTTIFLQNALSIRNYASGDPCSPIPTAA